jgi:hypothetical protein
MKRDENQNQEEGQSPDSLEPQRGSRRTTRLVVTESKRRKCHKFDTSVFQENCENFGWQGTRGTKIS